MTPSFVKTTEGEEDGRLKASPRQDMRNDH